MGILIDILETIYDSDEKSKSELKAALLKELEKVDSYAEEKLINLIKQRKSNTELMEAREKIVGLIDGLKAAPKVKAIDLSKEDNNLIKLELSDDWTNKNICSYVLRDKNTKEFVAYKATTYRDMFKSICKLFYDMDSERIVAIADTSTMMGVSETYVSKKESGVKNPIKIADNLYIERVVAPQTIATCIKIFLLEYGYMDWDFCIYVK